MAFNSFHKRVLASVLWMASLNACLETKPTLTVDLIGKGLPSYAFARTNYTECPYQYLSYRSVEWLDPQFVIVAFSTSPSCSKGPEILRGNLRLITFDLNGSVVRSTDVPYDTVGSNVVSLLVHDGVWIGPDRRVIVEVPGSHLKAQPSSRDKVLVLSTELSLEQEIDTDYHQTYYDAIRFEGVTADRQSVLFSTSESAVGRQRKCLLFRGKPLKQIGSCQPQDLDDLDLSAQYHRSDLFPKDYSVVFAGMSTDGRRASLFGVKKGGFFGLCDLISTFCPSSGRLVVFETAANHPLLVRTLPVDGRAALSPSGAHLAVLENDRLEVFSLP